MVLTVSQKQREALDFLYNQLRADEAVKKYKKIKKLSWRHSAHGRFHHTLRVLYYAKQIANKVMCDVEVVEMAAILHDIAKIEDSKNHAEKGATIAKNYLHGQGYSTDFIKRVMNCIRLHNLKGETPHADMEVKIIQDADLMDKRGFDTMRKLSHHGRNQPIAYIHLIKDMDLEGMREAVKKANLPFVRAEMMMHIELLENHIKKKETY